MTFIPVLNNLQIDTYTFPSAETLRSMLCEKFDSIDEETLDYAVDQLAGQSFEAKTVELMVATFVGKKVVAEKSEKFATYLDAVTRVLGCASSPRHYKTVPRFSY